MAGRCLSATTPGIEIHRLTSAVTPNWFRARYFFGRVVQIERHLARFVQVGGYFLFAFRAYRSLLGAELHAGMAYSVAATWRDPVHVQYCRGSERSLQKTKNENQLAQT